MLKLQVFFVFTYYVFCKSGDVPQKYLNVDLIVHTMQDDTKLSMDEGSVLLSNENCRVKITKLSENVYNIAIDGKNVCRSDEMIGECGKPYKNSQFYIKNIGHNTFSIKTAPGSMFNTQKCLTYGLDGYKLSFKECSKSKDLQTFIFEIAPEDNESKRKKKKSEEKKDSVAEKTKNFIEEEKGKNERDVKSDNDEKKEKLSLKNTKKCLKNIRLNCVIEQPKQYYPNNSPFEYPVKQIAPQQPQFPPTVVIMQ